MEEEWSRGFQNLDKYQREALSRNWEDIYRSIQKTDRDWAKMRHLRSEMETNDKRGFSSAYTAFMEIYDPPSSGSALGTHLLETDEEGKYTGLEEFSESLGLGTPKEEKSSNIDDLLEHN
ncbi:MAG: hypothetical protein ACI8Z7_000393 [Candidatus Nanohaloarchaea archaeon]|jgi:hypothetical protein